MSRFGSAQRLQGALLALLFVSCSAIPASAEILGVPGTSFTLTAKADRITTPDGNSIYFWGFAAGSGRPQYPGPTLKVTESQQSRHDHRRQPAAVRPARVPEPGRAGGRDGGVRGRGRLRPGADHAGGTHRRVRQLHVQAGATGDLPVQQRLAARPPGRDGAHGDAHRLSDDTRPGVRRRCSEPSSELGNPAGSQYDREYLFFLSEMDSEIHDLVEQKGVQAVDDSGRLGYYFPNYWFINGRNAPDTMAESEVAAVCPRSPTARSRARTRATAC